MLSEKTFEAKMEEERKLVKDQKIKSYVERQKRFRTSGQGAWWRINDEKDFIYVVAERKT